MVKKRSGTKILFDIFLILAIIIVSFFFYREYSDNIRSLFFGDSYEYTIYVGSTAVFASVADTPEELKKGLSGVKELPEFHGKLFIFDSDARHGIWMKDMNFPLDILWFDKNLKLVHIEENVDPSSYPKIFTPEEESRFVLELNAHFVDSLGIILGDTLTLPPAILPDDIEKNLY